MQEEFMREAIALSLENVRSGRGGPFGAVVAKGEEVVGRGTNLVTATGDPTAHAEMVAIRAACQKLRSFDLSGCELYASSEPCPMCLGAIYWARIQGYYYGNTRADAAQIGFDDSLIYDEAAKPPASRLIPGSRLLPSEAAEAFAEWARSSSKVLY